MTKEVRKLRAHIALVRMHIMQTRHCMQWNWWKEAHEYYEKAKSAMQKCEHLAQQATIGDP